MLDYLNHRAFGHFINTYNIADAHTKALERIARVGAEVTVLVHGEPVKTKEVLFMNLMIDNPLDRTIPPTTDWTNEAAIKEYAEKEILGKVIPEGFTYSYGNELQEPIDQVSRVIEMLNEDHSSRKASVRIGSPQRLFEQDPPCCMVVDSKERNHRLNMFLLFRSHDYGGALYPNLRAFAMLQERIAKGVGASVGVLGCTSLSAHVYEHDWGKLLPVCDVCEQVSELIKNT